MRALWPVPPRWQRAAHAACAPAPFCARRAQGIGHEERSGTAAAAALRAPPQHASPAKGARAAGAAAELPGCGERVGSGGGGVARSRGGSCRVGALGEAREVPGSLRARAEAAAEEADASYRGGGEGGADGDGGSGEECERGRESGGAGEDLDGLLAAAAAAVEAEDKGRRRGRGGGRAKAAGKGGRATGHGGDGAAARGSVEPGWLAGSGGEAAELGGEPEEGAAVAGASKERSGKQQRAASAKAGEWCPANAGIALEEPPAAFLLVATEAHLRLYRAAGAARGLRTCARKVPLPGRLRFAAAFAVGGGPALACLVDRGQEDHLQVRQAPASCLHCILLMHALH